MEQSTRELSMLRPEAEAGGSGASSRVSTPAPGLPGQMLGSCEDIGGSVSGLELEELTSLEKKIKRLEKAETAAVEKVKLLEMETQKLRENVDVNQKKLAKAEDKLEAANSELTVYVGLARAAAQLAAQKTELPLLSQKLIDEKNLEIEHLKQHLTALNSGSVSNIKHSTPNNNPAQPNVWISKLDDTSGSVENLRDATMMMRDRTSDLMSSPDQLAEAKDKVDRYRRGELSDITADEIWAAKHLVDSAYHPDTGKNKDSQ